MSGIAQPIFRPIFAPIAQAIYAARIGGFNPARLFASGEQGAWYDPSDFSTMFQDSAGTTPVTAVGQTVGRINDKSGRGNHATQATSSARPMLSARKNLLTRTDDFSVIPWGGAGVTALTTTSGTFAGTTSYRYNTANITGPITGRTFTASVMLSSASKASIVLRIAGQVTGTDQVNRNIALTATPTRYTITRTFTSTDTVITVGLDNRATLGGDGIAGDVTCSDWQFEETSVATRYQRVSTATDYDSVGFPIYRDFDLVDDAMVTTFPDLGTNVTIARSLPGVGASILTGQTIAAGAWSTSTDDCALVIVNRALASPETTNLAAWLNAKAGL